MSVNLAKEFLKSMNTDDCFFEQFFKTLNFYFRVLVSFSKKFFSQKSFQIVSTICGFAAEKIRQP